MPNKAWKDFERWVAEYFGGARVWKDEEDVSHPVFSFECKLRAKLARYLTEGVAQAIRNAPPGKLPVLILHEKGKRREDAIVCIPASYFRDWHA